MPVSGPSLIFLTLASIVLLLFLILVVKLHAFLALLLASMALGLATGMPGPAVLKSIQTGFGEALGFIAVVVGLGAMIERLVEHSGGGSAVANWMLGKFGRERARWAVLTTALLVGLPLFFEVGFIILAPLAWSLARESRRSLLYFGLPIAAALSATHSLVPPHPAPAAAAQLLGADLGLTILYGLAVSIPAAILGGIVYGGWIAKRMFIPVPAMAAQAEPDASNQPAPPVGLVILILLLPVLLILAARNGLLGHPFTALLATALVAILLFGFRRGLSRSAVLRLVTDSLAPIGTLLVIIGAGGAFKQVIVDSGVGPYLGAALAQSHISPLLVAYLTAAALRIAQGSATVAIITAAGIIAPLVKSIPGYRPEMIVLAVCCGGTVLSHVNDAGFWLVNEYFGMAVAQTLRSWTVMKVITSLAGFALVLAAQALFG
jgi:gluconate transporter